MTPETTFHLLFWILFGGVLLMRFYFIRLVRRSGERVLPNQQAIRQEGRVLFAFRLMSWFLMIAILVSYALNLPWLAAFNIILPDWLRWIGFLLGLVSTAFWTWTQVVLRENWSPQLHLREKHQLITAGPYAYIRHPMYAAIAGFGLGLAFVSANWILIVLAVMVIVGLVFRVPQEEKMLIEEFGEEYRKYMQHTGTWFPRLSKRAEMQRTEE